MKERKVYEAFDGRVFDEFDACAEYENAALRMYHIVTDRMRDVSVAMQSFLACVTEMTTIKIAGLDKYKDLFARKQSCDKHCSLYKVFGDYQKDYPFLFDLYLSLIEAYIVTYGGDRTE